MIGWVWNPETYLTFADHRARPFYDLLTRVAANAPRRVVDLGCGPGNLTETLLLRWPGATLEAWDSSPEMVAAAQARGLEDTPVRSRIGNRSPTPTWWSPTRHCSGCPRIANSWCAGPGSSGQGLDRLPGAGRTSMRPRTTRCVRWPGASRSSSRCVICPGDVGQVDAPAEYAGLLTDAGCVVDAWETTYVHQLAGETPVLDWITGTALTQVKGRLNEERGSDTARAIIPMLAEAYPKRDRRHHVLPVPSRVRGRPSRAVVITYDVIDFRTGLGQHCRMPTFTTADRTDIHYADAGSGPVLVFTHSWGLRFWTVGPGHRTPGAQRFSLCQFTTGAATEVPAPTPASGRWICWPTTWPHCSITWSSMAPRWWGTPWDAARSCAISSRLRGAPGEIVRCSWRPSSRWWSRPKTTRTASTRPSSKG